MDDILAFDLDGVICPDINLDWKSSDVEDLFRIRNLLPAIFTPPENSIIITGRPQVDYDHTMKWLTDNNIKISHIFLNNSLNLDTESVVTHKSSTLNRLIESGYPIVKFIESCPIQVKYIKELTKVPIEHFASYINKSLKGV